MGHKNACSTNSLFSAIFCQFGPQAAIFPWAVASKTLCEALSHPPPITTPSEHPLPSARFECYPTFGKLRIVSALLGASMILLDHAAPPKANNLVDLNRSTLRNLTDGHYPQGVLAFAAPVSKPQIFRSPPPRPRPRHNRTWDCPKLPNERLLRSSWLHHYRPPRPSYVRQR